MKNIIFDLDGTLAIIDKRRELSSKGDEFNWKIFLDPAKADFLSDIGIAKQNEEIDND